MYQDSSIAGQDASETPRQLARVLGILRADLRMDLVYLTEFVGDRQIVRHAVGNAETFGLEPGKALPLQGSYCQLVVTGRLEQVIPDTKRHPVTSALAVTHTANLGAYAGVPVHLEDERLYGTLCCASAESAPHLRPPDAALLALSARIVADVVWEERSRELLENALAMRTGDLREVNAKLAASHSEMARRLSRAVEYRDDTTGRHVNRVAGLSADIASAVGMPEAETRLLREAAPLHDVGKVAIPDAILRKPGPLTPRERAIMETHAQVGHDLMAGSDSPLLRLAAMVALTHHERFDGTGYPRGLRGENIPLAGRIVAIADVYDALSSDRSYRRALPPPEARRILEAGRGTQFDPLLLDLLLKRLREGAGEPRRVSP